jgi:hypothetical protein
MLNFIMRSFVVPFCVLCAIQLQIQLIMSYRKLVRSQSNIKCLTEEEMSGSVNTLIFETAALVMLSWSCNILEYISHSRLLR